MTRHFWLPFWCLYEKVTFVTTNFISLSRMYLYVDSLRETGEFQDKMQQYIQTTQDMYLGGVPADYMDTVRNRDFDSVILNSLKGGSIKDLTFEHE